MFERFTEAARRSVVLAQKESRDLGHGYIGTEHLLLGLLGDREGVAAAALRTLNVHADAARNHIETIVGRGRNKVLSGHIPFTKRAKKALELSLREAVELGHSYIGTEHILLGLIREGEGIAAQVLVDLGSDLNRARQAVLDIVPAEQSNLKTEQRQQEHGRLRTEIDRLRRLLAQHGIDPDDTGTHKPS